MQEVGRSLVIAERANDVHEDDAAAVSAFGNVRQCVGMAVPPPADSQTGLFLYLGAGGLLAICGMVIAWLKWRHPPQDK